MKLFALSLLFTVSAAQIFGSGFRGSSGVRRSGHFGHQHSFGHHSFSPFTAPPVHRWNSAPVHSSAPFSTFGGAPRYAAPPPPPPPSNFFGPPPPSHNFFGPPPPPPPPPPTPPTNIFNYAPPPEPVYYSSGSDSYSYGGDFSIPTATGEVVSYDFDGTLHSIDNDMGVGTPFHTMIQQIQADAAAGNKIVITTARHPSDNEEIWDFLHAHGVGHLVDNIYNGRDKAPILEDIGAVAHFDDLDHNLDAIASEIGGGIDLYKAGGGRFHPYKRRGRS